MADLIFGEFHQTPFDPISGDYPYPYDTLKFRFFFVKKGAKGVEMITFPTLIFVKKAKLKKILEGCNNYPPGRKRVKATD